MYCLDCNVKKLDCRCDGKPLRESIDLTDEGGEGSPSEGTGPCLQDRLEAKSTVEEEAGREEECDPPYGSQEWEYASYHDCLECGQECPVDDPICEACHFNQLDRVTAFIADSKAGKMELSPGWWTSTNQ